MNVTIRSFIEYKMSIKFSNLNQTISIILYRSFLGKLNPLLKNQSIFEIKAYQVLS